jgi:CRISPR/Cas system-associated exonuclease Cas4 (RecB family)
MHLNVNGKDCWVRGRMDAVIIDEVRPRIIDYKYAEWREGGEAQYEVQMTAYALAVMKALGAPNATAELWYLKPPMKIVRHDFTLEEATARLSSLLSNYLEAVTRNDWPAAERAYCDRIECGFRSRCWSAT